MSEATLYPSDERLIGGERIVFNLYIITSLVVFVLDDAAGTVHARGARDLARTLSSIVLPVHDRARRSNGRHDRPRVLRRDVVLLAQIRTPEPSNLRDQLCAVLDRCGSDFWAWSSSAGMAARGPFFIHYRYIR